jgi:hypothetical protein
MEVDDEEVSESEESCKPQLHLSRRPLHVSRSSDDFSSNYSLSLTDTTISSPSSPVNPHISPRSHISTSTNPFTFWSPYSTPNPKTPQSQPDTQSPDQPQITSKASKEIEEKEVGIIESSPYGQVPGDLSFSDFQKAQNPVPEIHIEDTDDASHSINNNASSLHEANPSAGLSWAANDDSLQKDHPSSEPFHTFWTPKSH